jgi:putative flippase GtrA
MSFATIGAVAFFIDAAVLYAARALGIGLYSGRVVSFLAAATFTWALNRRYTFAATAAAPIVQWGRFLAANVLGGFVNYGVYAALVAFVPLVHEHPVLGVAAGSLSGLVLNFIVSRQWVFRET